MAIDVVRTEGLGKRYGLHRALAGVELELKAGAVCTLLGPNGAGKSTLLGIVSSIVRPTAGTVSYLSAGKALSAGQALRREIGVLAHESFLYSGLNALENLEFWGRVYGLDNLQERSASLLRKIGLEEKAWSRTTNTYSRGMVQRLALARTMLHEPSLLLLDEPFTGLDRGGAAGLAEALGEAVQADRVVLVITHDLDAIADVTSHVAVLRRGKLAHEEHSQRFSGAELKDMYQQYSA